MLRLIALGNTNAEMATTLYLSVRTVESAPRTLTGQDRLLDASRARGVRARPGLLDDYRRPRPLLS